MNNFAEFDAIARRNSASGGIYLTIPKDIAEELQIAEGKALRVLIATFEAAKVLSESDGKKTKLGGK